MTKRKQGGFTLIELLVVIGILAVLLAIVLVAINPSRQFRQANNTKRTSDVNAILNAITQYGADYKGNLTGLSLATAGTPLALSAAGPAKVLCAAIVPTYIAALPGDPSTAVGTMPSDATTCGADGWDTKYTVTLTTTGRITVSATGENPADGAALPISVTR